MSPGLVAVAAAGWLVALVVAVVLLRRVRTLERRDEHLLARLSRDGVDGDDVEQGVTHVQEALREVRASQEELTKRVRLMDSVVERTPTGLLLIDSDGRIVEANPAFRAMVPVRDDLVGRLPVEGVRLAELQSMVDKVRAGSPTATVITTTGNRDLQLTVVPLVDDCAIVLVADITLYRQADRARTHFVSNVSHELRTPILSIMGFSETLLEEEGLDPMVDRQIKAVHRNAIRLRDLFEDLLELSRIEARRSELPLEVQPVGPILARASVAAADMAYERDQHFSLLCDDDLEAPVNPEALATIIGNLTSNACKYADEGGNISLSAWRSDNGQVVIEVADDGPGIDPAHHSRIFERFYRVDEGRSRAAGGTGLGLAIVKHLAMASGSRVTLDSAKGEGARFRVWLARKAA